MRKFVNVFRALVVGVLFVYQIGLPNMASANNDIDNSLAYLANHQDELSGGIFEEGNTKPDDGLTAWTAIAFATAGYDPATVKNNNGPSLIDYVSNNACTFSRAVDIERTILVVSASGLDPKTFGGCNLANELESMIDLNTGAINDSSGYSNDVTSTIFGVLALRSYNYNVPSAVYDYIANSQQADGGWTTGWGTESNITSQAIMALASVNYNLTSGVITNAKSYLKNLQANTGGIKYDANSWTTDTDSFSNAYSLQAIHSLGDSPNDLFWTINSNTILNDIARYKKPDNSYMYSLDPSWGDSTPVWTTATVIPALCGQSLSFIGTGLQAYNIGHNSDSGGDDGNNNSDSSDETNSNDLSNDYNSDNGKTSNNEEETNENDDDSPNLIAYTLDTNNPDDMDNNGEKDINATKERTNTEPAIAGAETENNNSDNKKPYLDIVVIITGLVCGVGASVLWSRKKSTLPVIILALILVPAAAHANQAGIVVRHSDGSVINKCVDFGEDYISGYDLLSRAGLNPFDDNGFIVEVDGERALTFNDPGATEDYWSYWILDDSSWTYSRASAKSSKVYNGQVDGWQRGTSDLLLADTTFSSICSINDNTSSAATAKDASTSTSTSIETSSDITNATIESSPPPAPIDPSADSSSEIISDVDSNSTDKSAENDSEIIENDDSRVVLAADADNNQSDKGRSSLWLLPVFFILLFAAGFFGHRLLQRRKINR